VSEQSFFLLDSEAWFRLFLFIYFFNKSYFSVLPAVVSLPPGVRLAIGRQKRKTPIPITIYGTAVCGGTK
jgi:hypothetical protein